ncbi:MAG TPA: sugar transferase, partial [Microbacteriaceae bacterium]|nr:sugar transferase [Microbacteriaceae bacterium]
LADLLRQQGKDDRPLFKIDGDPRITRFGQFIRRYSLDELPQFFNVIGGSMSLVGPRPQMPEEVALYDDVAHRRLLRRPGITGLWQVSGRSNLPWEEAMRLDLYYIENWSLIGDIEILFRTIRVVLAKDGAV